MFFLIIKLNMFIIQIPDKKGGKKLNLFPVPPSRDKTANFMLSRKCIKFNECTLL